MRVVIVGVGSSLRGDDAAGLAAVRLWQECYPNTAGHLDVQVFLEENPGLSLLDRLAETQVAILVDAVCSGGQVGALHLLRGRDIVAFSPGTGSGHGWGVAETLALAAQIDWQAWPDHLVLIGIEAGRMGLGADLSPEIRAILPEVADKIEALVANVLAGIGEQKSEADGS